MSISVMGQRSQRRCDNENLFLFLISHTTITSADLLHNFFLKETGDGKGTAKDFLETIAELESEAQRSLMHRFNISIFYHTLIFFAFFLLKLS